MYPPDHGLFVLEIEVKVPVDDISTVEMRASALGAKLIIEKVQEDLYLAHPCRDFGQTDEALRLRRDGEKSVLTYKGKKIDSRSKTREEIEFPVPREAMAALLSRLGFIEFVRIRKIRKEYVLDDVHICLDRVEGLGDFVELEFEGQNVEEGLARIGSVKMRLEIDGNETRSYLELLLQKMGK
jgi:adenylate cyclase class 2